MVREWQGQASPDGVTKAQGEGGAQERVGASVDAWARVSAPSSAGASRRARRWSEAGVRGAGGMRTPGQRQSAEGRSEIGGVGRLEGQPVWRGDLGCSGGLPCWQAETHMGAGRMEEPVCKASSPILS